MAATGRAVRELRRARTSDWTDRRLSQEQLAQAAGCDRLSINRWECDAYTPGLDRLFDVARALTVDPAVIVSPATVELLGRLRELVEKHAPTDAELDEGGDLWHGLRGALDRWGRS